LKGKSIMSDKPSGEKKKKRIKKARSQKLQQKSQLPLLAKSLLEKKRQKGKKKAFKRSSH